MDPISAQSVLATAGAAAGDATYVDDVFSTYVYEGTGAAKTITNGIDLSGEGGLVWIKHRDTSRNHSLYDTERGVLRQLVSNHNYSQGGASGNDLDAFNSNGFSLGTDTFGIVNESGGEYVSWSFRKAPGFFDVVTYTGDSSTPRAISHNLGSTPGMIIIKRVNISSNWICYHRSIGAQNILYLNSTDAQADADWAFADTAPTSTHFTVHNHSWVNASGSTYIAYLFAHDDQSFGTNSDEAIIKCGSYTGSGGSVSVDVGFEPQWMIIKNKTTASNQYGGSDWRIYDMIRGLSTNDGRVLRPNTTDSEGFGGRVVPDPNGFRIDSESDLDINNSGDTYIYIAIRRPNKPPESGTDVFAIDNQGTGTMPPQYHSNFVVDMALEVAFGESQTYRNRRVYTRLMNGKYLKANLTNSQFNTNYNMFSWMDGFGNNNSSVSTSYAWMFKRAPGFFDVVVYKGTGSARTLDHNLEAVPELVIVKNMENSSYGWSVYVSHLSSPRDKAMYLNDTMAAQTNNAGTFWGNTDFTSTQISLGSYANTNHSGINMIAYLFASLDGISKIGTYSGTGYAVNVDCGFTAGARFVMIKRTDTEISGTTGTHWYVWDSTRGIVSGNDPYFTIGSTDADVTNTDYVDPLNAGFTVTSSAPAALNASGGTYLFLAIA